MKWIKFWESKKEEMRQFCRSNNLSIDELWRLDKSYSRDFMLFALPSDTKGNNGLYDDEYGEAVLLVEIKKNKLVFTKTEAFKKITACFSTL